MLNSAASALVDTESAGTGKRKTIGRNITSQYGNVENNTETLKEQLETLNIKKKDVLKDRSPLRDKMASQTSTGEENGYVKQPQCVGNVSERKQSSPTTERGKRALPATPKSLYSTQSQSSLAINQSAENVTLSSERLSTSSSRSSNTSLSSEDDHGRSKTKQTHIVLYKFVARHDDEMNLETGDAVHVNKKCEDLWFEGINLRTGQSGIFPSRYVSDILRESDVQGKSDIIVRKVKNS